MNIGDRRLIEDVIPIEVISQESASEKVGGRLGHPSTLHLWWARRPLAACRAAVYATLVAAEGRNRTQEEETQFFQALCEWGGPQAAIDLAREEVLAANGGKPPKIVDMFGGGGAIPLEAARLGCETTAIELNPVAFLIEKCMLEYPQRFPGLADDVRRWGRIWVDSAREKLKDLYPPVGPGSGQQELSGRDSSEGRRPLAYLWTRTVKCPNPALADHEIQLLRQTWLAQKRKRHIALKPVVDREVLEVRYEVVEAADAQGLGFDPAAGSRRGQATCRLCGTVVGSDYVKAEGKAGRIGISPLAAVVLRNDRRGREYLPVGSYAIPDDSKCMRRIEDLEVQPPDEPLVTKDTLNVKVPLYGLTRFRDLFTARQLLSLCTLASGIREIHRQLLVETVDAERARAIAAHLALVLDRTVDRNSALCRWDNSPGAEKVNNTLARQALPMVWDFAEANPFSGASGDPAVYVEENALLIERLASLLPVTVARTSATTLPLEDGVLDAIVTDPPYYDNISYSDLSDFFYVWLKRSVGDLYPDDFAGEVSPKKSEAIVAPYRHGGSKVKAREFYEEMMRKSFMEANRVLKAGAPLVCIYAHKTTLGWATLVDSLRGAGFTITEAWPLDTEMTQAVKKHDTASLASSIFLVARKRTEDVGTGYESEVLKELDGVISERLDRLSDAGISGSDLIIATVGAGLKAFTRFERVEQDNGEELPSERFLQIVQNRVLDAVFGGLQGVDSATRFYVGAQFAYGYAWVPFAEANNLAYMTGVELDGPRGLTAGGEALVAKEKSKIKIRDFDERGEDPNLGIRRDSALEPSVIDVAQGLIWRAEYRPAELKDYLNEARPDAGLLRKVIQALAGKGLRGSPGDGKALEAAAAERILASWRRLVEDNLFRKS